MIKMYNIKYGNELIIKYGNDLLWHLFSILTSPPDLIKGRVQQKRKDIIVK